MRRIYEPVELTEKQKQLLLGTVLGDGCMSWAATYGRYRLAHGAIQADYCRHKAAILGSLISVQPKIVPNLGYGKELCVSSTRSHPCFEFLRPLCYRLNPETGRLAKHVTPEWLDQLDWEGIAYWYLDDGGINKPENGNPSITFSTHSFPKEEVELLAEMLTKRGVEAKANPVHKGQKVYWVILLGVEATRIFRDKIRSFVPSCMSYKLEIPNAVELTCAFCGATFTPFHPNQAGKPICPKKSCRELRRKEITDKYLTTHSAKIKQNRHEAYHTNLEQSRANGRERARLLRLDPARRAKMNKRKRAWRQKRAILREPAVKPCQFCRAPVQLKNGQFLPNATICCQAPECRRKRQALHNQHYAERHATELAERHRNWNQSERGKKYKQDWHRTNCSTPTSSLSNTPEWKKSGT